MLTGPGSGGTPAEDTPWLWDPPGLWVLDWLGACLPWSFLGYLHVSLGFTAQVRLCGSVLIQ